MKHLSKEQVTERLAAMELVIRLTVDHKDECATQKYGDFNCDCDGNQSGANLVDCVHILREKYKKELSKRK